MEVFRADIDHAVVRLLESGVHRNHFEITNTYVSRLKTDTIKRLIAEIDLSDERIRERVRWLMRLIGAKKGAPSVNRKTLFCEAKAQKQSELRRNYEKSLEELSALFA